MRASVRASCRLAVAVSLALCAAPVRGAHAAGPDDAEADALIARGIELRQHDKDDEALALFKKALAKSPTARARAQVALAEQALGVWGPAESDLLLALAAKEDPWIQKHRAALEGALAVVRRHLGSLEVRGTPGAEVVLDGISLGTLPSVSPYRVEAGSRFLELRARGYYPTTRAVEIPAGGVARETVSLVALPHEPSAGGAGAGAGAGGGTGAAEEKPASTDAGRGQRILGWTFAGTGAALLVTGGIGLLVRKGIVDGYNVDCPGLGVEQPAGCSDKIESARTWLTVSLISLVGGGVFAIGGLALVATAPRGSAAVARSGVWVGCAPGSVRGGASLVCSGSF